VLLFVLKSSPAVPPDAGVRDAGKDRPPDIATEIQGGEDADWEDTPTTDSGLPAEQAWLADPARWTTIPGSEFTQPACVLMQAEPSGIGFPPLQWVPCADGSGCDEANVVQGYGDIMARPTMSTHRLSSGPDGTAMLSGMGGVKTASHWYIFRRAIRLDTGATTDVASSKESATSTTTNCVFGSDQDSARFKIIAADPSGQNSGGRGLFGFAAARDMPGFWNQPWGPLANYPFHRSFDIDHGGGNAFFLASSAIVGFLTPGSSELTTVVTTGGGILRGAGEGDLGIWSRVDGTIYSIEGWSPNGGVRTIIPSMATPTCSVGVSSTQLAGFTGDFTGVHCEYYANPRFWLTPRAYTPAEVNLTVSPAFSSNPSSVYKLVSWGGHVAAYIIEDPAIGDSGPNGFRYLVLGRTADWKFRRLVAPEGRRVHNDAFTLTDTSLYWAFAGTKTGEEAKIQTIRRYDLSKFDQIGDPI
jgi:hypothetical protein